MHGFDRWYGEGFDIPSTGRHSGAPNYDPITDPLRISNLDQDVLQEIREAIEKSKIKVKHVVILSLESTRKDVFPVKHDSHLTEVIRKAFYSEEEKKRVVDALSDLTLNAELLTGEVGGFGRTNFSDASKSLQKLPADKGGLNIVGAFTGSTSTFKSMLGSHCGVQPLPVDFTVEATHGHIYQPCIPSILKLLNRNKRIDEKDEVNSRQGGLTTRPWKSVFVQSITDTYDHQDSLNRFMGFDDVVVKSNLTDPSSKYPPTEPE